MNGKGPSHDVILVTGSSGFLGHALCRHFGAHDRIVIGFDKDGPPYPPPNTDCLFCDLTSDESMQKTFQLLQLRYGNKIRAVFHLAAYYSFSGEDSKLYEQLNVKGTGRLLRELQNCEVGQFIYSSSMLVHKPNGAGERLTEKSPIEPTWQYPKSKAEAEALLKEQHGSIPLTILRIAGVYDDACRSIPLAHQIQRIYENRLEGHFYPGDLSVRQSFVHVSDVVSAFEAAVNKVNDLPPEAVFLIGEPSAMTYEELQNDIARLTQGSDWLTWEVPKPVAKVGSLIENVLLDEKPFIKPWMIDRADDNFEVDITGAKAVLGWHPTHSLRGTLPTIIDELRRDPVKWYKINKLEAPHWLNERVSQPEESRRVQGLIHR